MLPQLAECLGEPIVDGAVTVLHQQTCNGSSPSQKRVSGLSCEGGTVEDVESRHLHRGRESGMGCRCERPGLESPKSMPNFGAPHFLNFVSAFGRLAGVSAVRIEV